MKIDGPSRIHDVIASLPESMDRRDVFYLVHMDAKGTYMGVSELSRGRAPTPKEVVDAAEAGGGDLFVIARNKPASFDSSPTNADASLVRKLAGTLPVDVKLADYVIVGGDTSFSFRRDGPDNENPRSSSEESFLKWTRLSSDYWSAAGKDLGADKPYEIVYQLHRENGAIRITHSSKGESESHVVTLSGLDSPITMEDAKQWVERHHAKLIRTFVTKGGHRFEP